MATGENRFSFTQERLAAVVCRPSGRPQKDGRAWVYDTKIDGLAFSVTEGGARAYFLYRRIKKNHKVRKIKIGDADKFNVEQARRQAATLNNEIERGIDPAEERKAERDKALNEATLGDLWASYRDHWLANKRPRSIQDFTQRYEAYLSRWENRPLLSIERADVEKLKIEIGKKSQVTANRVIAILGAMYARRGNTFRLPEGFNPTRGVDRYPEHARDRVLDSDELGKIMQAIDSEESHVARDYFKMLIYTGQRRATVAKMTWQDASIERGTWRIPGEKTKNGTALVVTLIPEAIAILKRRGDDNPPDSPFVFPARNLTAEQVKQIQAMRTASKSTRVIADDLGISQSAVMRAMSPRFVARGASAFGGIGKAWTRILNRAGIAHATIHDIRRSFCTTMIENGTPLPIVAAAMGHKAMATTMKHYSFASDKTVAEAVRSSMSGLLANVKKSQEKRKAAKSA